MSASMVVGVVGLGLMGGSIGLALRKVESVSKVLGYDHDHTHEEASLKLGCIDEIAKFDSILECDVIILAIPVNAIVELFEKLKSVKKDTLIIDLGSTKKSIVEAIPSSIRENFVAAHPMTGTEKFGPYAAVEKLYEDKIIVLCDIEQSADLQKSRAIEIFNAIGMNIVYMDSEEHDLHAAFISHLPHAISFALANTVLSQEDPKSILNLAAGGFRDMSRLAKSSPHMWEAIFDENRTNVLESIELFERELSMFKEHLKNRDYTSLHYNIKQAASLHDIL